MTRFQAILAAALVLASARPALSQAQDEALTAAQLEAFLARPVDGFARQGIWSGEGYAVSTAVRLVAGEPEIHAEMSDIFVVQAGRAEVLLGGAAEGGRLISPGEHRGGRIVGGRRRALGPGDILWIPAGEPHQVLPTAPPFRYLTVKVRKAAPSPPVSVLGGFAFLEGPAATEAGDLYFTDVKNNRIWKRTAQGETLLFRERANYANGLAIDGQGRLLAAESGDAAAGTPARITRTDLSTGRVEVLASGYAGKAFNGPNDIVVDGHGRIFFTDWARPDFIPPLPGVAANPFAVYRIDPDGAVRQVLAAPQVQAPNGVMVSPDDHTLYLVESDRAAGGARRIDAYPLGEDGALGAPRLFHDFSPGRSGDGMAVDRAGNLWVAAGLNALRPGGETLDTRAGVYQFAPDGRLLSFIPIGEDLITNVAFGGPDRRTLYITAGKSLLEVPAPEAGTRR